MNTISRLTNPADRDSAACLFGRCVAEHWPVDGPETGYGWVQEELQLDQTVVLGIKDAEGVLVACIAATPLSLMWEHLSDEERELLMIGLCALEDSEGIEIPRSIIHVGSIAVDGSLRGQNIPERLFAELLPILKREYAEASLLVAQTARPDETHPQLRGLRMCLRLGFAELLPERELSRTVGGLRRAWLWRTLF